jgi:BASS family bile acid:Na+ symporter
MSIQNVTSLLVAITVAEMMTAIGLEVRTAELRTFARDLNLIARALLANYVAVPLVTIGLLSVFQPSAAVAAGFLILAVCPGAPFAPPLTAIAKGDIATAAGLMALLAASSTFIAPLQLVTLLPVVSGQAGFTIDLLRLLTMLAITQLLPFCGGLLVRSRRPQWASAAQKPARLIGVILSVTSVVMVVATNYHTLTEVRAIAYLEMLTLLAASFAIGWLLAGRDAKRQKALALTTSARNVGLALMISSTAFAGSAAANAVVAYGLLEIFGSLGVAFLLGRTQHSRTLEVPRAVASP